jgi:hydroxysqualene dehydroxylase
MMVNAAASSTVQHHADRPRRLAVIGGGWAGLAAAVRAVERGFAVVLFDMAPQLGGRARSVVANTAQGPLTLDNGQHILIGAYRDTLALMRQVGLDVDAALLRQPLRLVDPFGVGLRVPSNFSWLGSSMAFARGVLQATHWPLADRLALMRTAAAWRLAGFTCATTTTVDELTHGLPETIRRDLVEPLCVAALNTPSSQASGTVFLRVMRDALFGGPGSADLLIPKVPLAGLLPNPAAQWLTEHGARVVLRSRVQSVVRSSPASAHADVDAHAHAGAWRVDGDTFDAVVLACSAHEAARLASSLDPGWAALAARVPYQAIVTVYAHHPEAQLTAPMVALTSTAEYPAQFAFDHGMLSGRAGLLAFVVSGANDGLARGQESMVDATLAQARQMLPRAAWVDALSVVATIAERRATFACRPDVARPPARLAGIEGLVAAGDYVQGPYPATLEGSVRSGLAAIDAIDDMDASKAWRMHNR